MKPILTFISLLITLLINFNCNAAIITAITDGAAWNNVAAWDLGRAPICGDTIIVPAGIDLRITATVNLDSGDPICGAVRISIAGSIAFSNGRKMRLAAGACVSVENGGRVRQSFNGGGSSESIDIDGEVVWKAGDGNLVGPATMGCPVVLPVELISFEIEYSNETALLNFSTQSERDLLHFVVEISRDGHYWQELELITASGNSSDTKNYSVVDKTPFIGTSYYRLTSFDIDGSKSELGILSGEFTSAKYLLYPIPVNKTMFLEGDNLENSKIKVVNSLGELLEIESTFVGDKLSYNFSEVKSGVYFLVIENDKIKKTERIVVVHK